MLAHPILETFVTTPDLGLDREFAAAVAQLPQPSLDDLLRARNAADAGPAASSGRVPSPVLPYGLHHPLSGTVRWSCAHGCGWGHAEDLGADLTPMRLVLPAGFTGRDVSDALTARATARHEAMLRRVEDAFAEHYASAHPDRQRGDRA